jgi:amino acid transporter
MTNPGGANHSAAPKPELKPKLARQLGLFDATMLVMGGIVGSGIFINPYVVAQQVHTPALILGAWIFGGVVGIGGAFIWAELAATLPEVGGQYAYLREAYHPHSLEHVMPGMYELNEEVVCRRRASGDIPWGWNVGIVSPKIPPQTVHCKH